MLTFEHVSLQQGMLQSKYTRCKARRVSDSYNENNLFVCLWTRHDMEIYFSRVSRVGKQRRVVPG